MSKLGFNARGPGRNYRAFAPPRTPPRRGNAKQRPRFCLAAEPPGAVALARRRTAATVRPGCLLAPLRRLVDARARLEALDLHHRQLVAGEALDLAHEVPVVAAE